jgi:hypothetical protein
MLDNVSMIGIRSEEQQVDVDTSKFNVSCLYSIECLSDSSEIMRKGTPIGETLNLGTMRRHFLRASNEMPWRISTIESLELALGCELEAGLDGPAGLDLYAVPDAGLVGLLSLDYVGSIDGAVDLLHHLTFSKDRLSVAGKPLPDLIAELAAPVCPGEILMGQDMFHVIVPDSSAGILTEGNVNIPPAPWPKQLDLTIATKLIYKVHDSVRPDFTSLRMPVEANRHSGQIACVALSGVLLIGQPEWFQQCVLGSSIIAIAALSRLRAIRRDTFDALRQMEGTKFGVMNQGRQELSDARAALAALSEELRALDISLASGVEAMMDVTAVLPSPRLASYHTAAVESMGITTGSTYVANLVDRLRYSIAAQRDAIAAAERQRDEERRAEVSIVAGALSTVAIVAGIFFGFFGVNAAEVNQKYPFFDHHYLGFYLVITGVVLLLLGLFGSLRLRRYLRRESHR